MKELKDFVNGLPKLDESIVLSDEEQEMVEAGGNCTSCSSGCQTSNKKTSIIIVP